LYFHLAAGCLPYIIDRCFCYRLICAYPNVRKVAVTVSLNVFLLCVSFFLRWVENK
jgi:hypothetical protein